ncbi:MAG: hypothetical protein IJ467_01150 [Bacteroidaceae bacterium]|nr:hypothetical protein [Bacteroidaceae bacterium]
MKKYFVYLCFFISVLQVNGEDISPVYLTEGAEWKEVATVWTQGLIVEEYLYSIKGDTLVNDTAYKKIYCNNAVFALTRHTQDKKVYLRMVNSLPDKQITRWERYRVNGPEILWYDFGTTDAGKRLIGIPALGNFGDAIYAEADSVGQESTFSGKRLDVAYGPTFEVAYGIGDIQKGIMSRMHKLNKSYGSERFRFISFSFKGETLVEAIPQFVGTVWSYTRQLGEAKDSLYDYLRYTVPDEPEILNGHRYYPLVCYRDNCHYNVTNREENATTVCHIREDGARIYVLKKDYDCPEDILLQSDGEDYLLYDYMMQEGETFCHRKNGKGEWEPVKARYMKSESVGSNDEYYEDKEGPLVAIGIGESIWISGAGSLYDFLHPLEKSGITLLNNYKSERFSGWNLSKLEDYGIGGLKNKEDDCTMNGEDHKKMIVANKQWMAHVYCPETGNLETRLTVLKEDTILYKGLKGETYLKMYAATREDWSDAYYTGECYREDASGSVFRYNHSTQRDETVMRFDRTAGSTIMQEDGTILEIASIKDTILQGNNGGLPRKCIYLKEKGKTDAFVDIWLEGVGSLKYGLYKNLPHEKNRLLCSLDHGMLTYCSTNDGSCYMEPVSGIYPRYTSEEDRVMIAVENNQIRVYAKNGVVIEFYGIQGEYLAKKVLFNDQCIWKVPHAPAAYLYIVTYPDGHRESGKVMVED